MSKCWETDPNDRPDFGDLYFNISKQYQQFLKANKKEETAVTPVSEEYLEILEEKNEYLEVEPPSAENEVYAPESATAIDSTKDSYLVPDKNLYTPEPTGLASDVNVSIE